MPEGVEPFGMYTVIAQVLLQEPTPSLPTVTQPVSSATRLSLTHVSFNAASGVTLFLPPHLLTTTDTVGTWHVRVFV